MRRLNFIRQRVFWVATLLTLAALLSACGGAPPPAAQIPTPLPTSTPVPATLAADLPTTMPTETPASAELATPTAFVSATDSPAADGLLPAPVYFIDVDTGQIMRMDRDGVSLTQLTFESLPVIEFDVAADAGTITYIYGDDYGDDTRRSLVILDGGGRRELLSGQISMPRVNPDGQMVAVRIDKPEPGLIAGQDQSPAGVWALPTDGSQPSLLIADDSIEGQEPPDGVAWLYTPVGYDHGGQRLLLWAYNMAGPAIPGGELVILGRDAAPLHSEPTCCEGAVWSADGSAVTIVGGGPGPDIRYGLFQIDAATGVEQTLIGQGDSSYPLVLGARQLLDGNTYAFYEEVPGDVFSWEYPFTSQMVRVDADGAITPLRQDSYPPSKVLWRDDASGALLTVWDMALDNPLAGSLVWADITGSPAIKTGVVGSNVLWADSVRPLYEGDCSLLPQVGWQPPEARTFSTGAADLQARLGAQGFDAGSPDGYFGDQTRAALRQFQTSRGIPPGDRLDCATWQALLGRP